MNSYILANWCLSSNVGDLLTPYLIEKLSGEKCIYSLPESESLKYIVVGSILNWDIKNVICWGAGIADKDAYIGSKNILSTRGPLSKKRAIECGNQCENASIGDPALLMPSLYYPKIKESNTIGVFPHYVDLEHVYKNLNNSYKIISPLNSVETVIDEILSCKRIISSSLHGLILAEAYKKETQWVKFSDRIGGDGTKFLDHYLSINQTNQTCIDVRNETNLDNIKCSFKKISPEILKDMLSTCPFYKKVIELIY